MIHRSADVVNECGFCHHRWLAPQQGLAAVLDMPKCPNCGRDEHIIHDVLPETVKL